MAVAIVDSGGLQTSSNPATTTLDVPSTGQILYALVATDETTVRTPTVTFNGVGMSQIATTAGTGQSMTLHRLINPGIVTGGVLSASQSGTKWLGYVLVSGADTTTPNGTPLVQETTTDTNSLNGGAGVASQVDGLVLSFLAANNQTSGTPTGVGQVEIEEILTGAQGVLCISATPGTGSTVVNAWSWPGNNRGSMFAVAIAPAGGGSSDPVLTDVNTTEVVAEGETGVPVTGTDMGADETERVFTLEQGAVSVPQTETGSGTSTAATLTIGIEQSGADIKFGAASLVVTRDDTASDDIALTVQPPTGQLYVDIGTPDTEAGNRITAVDDIASGDQLHARGEGGGAAPDGLNLEDDGTFWFDDGETPVAFDVRVWDASDATWGSWATQSMDAGDIVATAEDTITLFDAAVAFVQYVATGADTLTLSDAAASITQRVAAGEDTVTLTDEAEAEITSAIAASAEDTLTLSDAAASITQRVATAEDSLTLSDAALSATTRLATAEDTLTLSDSAAGEVTSATVTTAQDALTLSDAAQSVTQRLSVASDAVTLSDAAASAVQAVATAEDTLTLSDASEALVTSTVLATAEDTLTLSDSATGDAVIAVVATAADTLTLSDAAASVVQAAAHAGDSLALTDEAESITIRLSTAEDSLLLSDAAQAAFERLLTAEDAITFSDSALALNTQFLANLASIRFSMRAGTMTFATSGRSTQIGNDAN